MFLLTDYHPGKGFVSSWDILEATGLFSEVIFYRPPVNGLADLFRFVELAIQIRKIKPDSLFYLRDSRRHTRSRDRFFFGTLCGIDDCIGLDHPDDYAFGSRDESGNLARLPSEAQRLLTMIGNAGLPPPRSVREAFGLPISEKDRLYINLLWQEESISDQSISIGLCPGSKMPAKRWWLDRYKRISEQLLSKSPDYRVIVFGGSEDQTSGDEIRRSLGERVINLAGRLSLLESAEALRRCRLYVGNDTGVMHLAAAVGTPCVAIFSARDHPGRWEPFGSDHVVLRREVPCAGCMLDTCIEMEMRCMKEIGVDEVLNAAEQVLLTRSQVQSAP
jgi:ADP-heptose:LPS heptosyltransferase